MRGLPGKGPRKKPDFLPCLCWQESLRAEVASLRRHRGGRKEWRETAVVVVDTGKHVPQGRFATNRRRPGLCCAPGCSCGDRDQHPCLLAGADKASSRGRALRSGTFAEIDRLPRPVVGSSALCRAVGARRTRLARLLHLHRIGILVRGSPVDKPTGMSLLTYLPRYLGRYLCK